MILLDAGLFSKHFIVLLREGFEAFLVLFIILGFLSKTGRSQFRKSVFLGAGLAVGLSLLLALVLYGFHSSLEGQTGKIFEGITMWITAILLGGMILWLIRFQVNVSAMKDETARLADQNRGWGLALLVFFSIFREGAETVLFLLPKEGETEFLAGLGGGLLGLGTAFGLSWALFRGLIKLNYKAFFGTTTALLLFMAAGMAAYGTHELIEAGWLPALQAEIWNINPPVGADSSYPALHEKGWFGGVLKAIFGYNGNPDLLEFLIWLGYLIVGFGLWARWARK